MKGIDVSTYQGVIDWPQVKAAGYDFAIIRLGIGTNGMPGDTCELDNYFVQNIEGAIAAGLYVGVYLYSYAQNSELARFEAEFALKAIEPYKGNLTYPVIFDLEDRSQRALAQDVLSDIIDAFCGSVEAAGYYAMLYVNLDWLRNVLDPERVRRYDIWLAQYNDEPTYEGSFGIWQYTSSGSVPGIAGNVDLNEAYKDYPSIIRENGLFGHQRETPEASQQEQAPEAPADEAVPIFSDIEGHWAKDSILKCVEAGIIVGEQGGTFGPDDPLTRGEAAVLHARLLDKLRQAGISV